MNEFKDKVALISGASSGIGKATALAFVQEGSRVVIGDIQVEAGKECASQIKKHGGEAQFIQCDVGDPQAVLSLIQKTVSTYGSLDFAFNNAGIEGQSALTADTSEENWERVIRINLKGVWSCMKYEILHMLKQGSGTIVNCASIAGLVGFQGLPAYVASKHGIIGLTKTAALEYSKNNIRINAVCPGAIHTPMLERVAGGAQEINAKFTPYEPMGRIGQPEEIAEAVLWLCSSKSSFVTGHALVVDGGWVAQ